MKSEWLHVQCVSLNLPYKSSVFCPHSAFRCFYGSQNKQQIFPYTIHTGITTQTLCVLCAVRNEYCKIMYSILLRLVRPCHHGMARPQVADEQPPIWKVAANMLNKQGRTADNGWSSCLGVGRGANNSSP